MYKLPRLSNTNPHETFTVFRQLKKFFCARACIGQQHKKAKKKILNKVAPISVQFLIVAGVGFQHHLVTINLA